MSKRTLILDSDGGVTLDDVNNPAPAPFLNLIRNPNSPYTANATIFVSNSAQFTNDGSGVTWIPYDFGVTDSHRLLTIRDPLTGHARLILGDDQGVWSIVDNNGTLSFDEWAVKAETKFALADKDKSGAMNAAEFATTAVKRKSKPRPNCRPTSPAPASAPAEDNREEDS